MEIEIKGESVKLHSLLLVFFTLKARAARFWGGPRSMKRLFPEKKCHKRLPRKQSFWAGKENRPENIFIRGKNIRRDFFVREKFWFSPMNSFMKSWLLIPHCLFTFPFQNTETFFVYPLFAPWFSVLWTFVPWTPDWCTLYEYLWILQSWNLDSWASDSYSILLPLFTFVLFPRPWSLDPSNPDNGILDPWT